MSALGLAKGAAVLVPLCGKSLDLVWLAEQGHAVIGVELAEAFVKEQQRAAMLKQQLATQQQLGADQAPHAMDYIVHYFARRGSTP